MCVSEGVSVCMSVCALVYVCIVLSVIKERTLKSESFIGTCERQCVRMFLSFFFVSRKFTLESIRHILFRPVGLLTWIFFLVLYVQSCFMFLS